MVSNIPSDSGGTSPIYSNYDPVNPADEQSTPSYYEQFQTIVKDSSLTRDEKFAKLDALKDELEKQVENLPKSQQTAALAEITSGYSVARAIVQITQRPER